ncbi:ankyrin repeat-containing domain protein [Rhypophila decipiens]|uniref:Ankyrin repeat-containing domain protein n=1 Tax=Rhypophila decipiens TaxID=261697 RepID=A0AAN6XXB7_9PEZI|nr:ankyrin repeat-containing domain protein [Rhypophila decipiens]
MKLQEQKLEKQNAYEKAQAAATMASRRSRKVRQETLNKQAAAQGQAPQQQQQQQPNTNQGQPITIPDDDVHMQEGGEGSGEDEDEDSLPEEEGPWIAPLAQPILPLRLPSVRPTLLLGPYETREECHRAAQDYAIKQGFVLVMRGCHRGKNAEGKYGPGGEVVRVDLKCSLGGTCTNRGKGLRRRKTNRLGCPAKFKLMRRISNANKWFIELICEEHNHDLDPNNMELNASYRRWKRKEEGKTGRESYKERYALLKKQKEAVPVPEPQLHQIGLQTEAPTGPIHLAALKGQYKILEILLSNGGDLNAKDAYGRTPLHCAVEGQKMDCVTLLVDRGADVRVLNNKGVSALHMAVEKGMEDAVVMFIEKGADPNR